MKKLTIILLVTIVLASLFGCSNSSIRYEYQGDYKNDPNLQQDIDRDRQKH